MPRDPKELLVARIHEAAKHAYEVIQKEDPNKVRSVSSTISKKSDGND